MTERNLTQSAGSFIGTMESAPTNTQPTTGGGTLIHILDGQTDEIIGTLNTKKGQVSEPLMTRSIENFYTFNMDAFAHFDLLTKRNRLLVQDADGFFTEFIISYTDQYERDKKEVRSLGSFIDLQTAKVIPAQTLAGITPLVATTTALSGTEWLVGDVDYTGNIRTIDIEEYTNPYNLLKLISSTFDMEIRYRVEVSGNRIVGRYVDMVEQIAGFEGKEIEFGKDLIGIRRVEDSSNIVTALVGLGPIKEDGTRLEVYVEDQEALEQRGRNGRHLVRAYEPETIDEDMTVARLRQLTEAELKKRIDAVTTYECQAVSLESVFGRSHEKIRLGQTVRIKDGGYIPPLYLEARIRETTENVANRQVVDFKIGNFIEHSKDELEKQVKVLRQLLAQKVDDARLAAALAHAETELREYTEEKADGAESNAKDYADSQDLTVYQDGTVFAEQIATTKADEAKADAALDATQKANDAEQGAKDYTDDNAVIKEKKYTNGLLWSDLLGLIVERSDGNLRTVMSGTDGFYIEQKIDDDWVKSFWADENGVLTLNGIYTGTISWNQARGGILELGGLDDVFGRLIVYDDNGETIADLDSAVGGFSELFVGNLISPSIVNYNRDDRVFYVDPLTGNDERPGSSWASAKQTIQSCIDEIPKYNDGNIRILLHFYNCRNMYEHLLIDGFVGNGSVIIEGQTKENTVNGSIDVRSCLNRITFTDLSIGMTGTYTGSFGLRALRSPQVSIIAANIIGTIGTGILSGAGSRILATGCQINDTTYGMAAREGGFIYAENCGGKNIVRGMYADEGSVIAGTGSGPEGGTSNTYARNGAEIRGTFTYPTPPTPPVRPPVTQTLTVTSTEGRSYRTSIGAWDLAYSFANTVAQGYWSSVPGLMKGAWFFGSQLSPVVGKTIKSMRVWVQRESAGGNGGAVTVRLKPHNYSSRPAGNPAMRAESVNVSLGRGQGKWVTMPASFYAPFAANTAKGIGVEAPSSSTAYYARLINVAKIEVTYQ